MPLKKGKSMQAPQGSVHMENSAVVWMARQHFNATVTQRRGGLGLLIIH